MAERPPTFILFGLRLESQVRLRTHSSFDLGEEREYDAQVGRRSSHCVPRYIVVIVRLPSVEEIYIFSFLGTLINGDCIKKIFATSGFHFCYSIVDR